MPRRPVPRRAPPQRPPGAGAVLRRAADVLLVLAVGLLGPLLGGATSARAGGTLEVTSGTWAAAAAPVGAAAGTGPLAVPWSQGGSVAVGFVDVVVTGTLPLTGVRLRLDTDDPDDGPSVAVAACLGAAWDDGSCAGTTLPLGDLTATTDLAAALAPGDRLALRAEAPRNVAERTTFLLRVEVPRAAAAPSAERSG